MGLRFQSQWQVDNLPEEQLTNQFEVVMPTIDLYAFEAERDSSGAVTIPDATKLDKSNSSGSDVGFLKSAWNSISSVFTEYTPIVEEIKFGVRNFGTADRRVRTGWCNVPDDIKNYGDVAITMFCSSGMLTQYYLQAWQRLMFNEGGEYYWPMKNYKKDIHVYFYGPGNISVGALSTAHYILRGCFPYSQSQYSLSYTNSPKRLTLTATFKCDKIEFDSSSKAYSIGAELVSNPMSMIDRGITKVNGLFGEQAGATNINDLYS